MLGEVVRNRPEIALDDFLPIFLSKCIIYEKKYCSIDYNQSYLY